VGGIISESVGDLLRNSHWVILEQLKDEKEFPRGMSLAVVPDEESGGRTIINTGDRKAYETVGRA